jgi:DNA repair ATPase RecN
MAEINWGIVTSLVSLAITIFTIVYSNAKNSEHTNSRIDVVETKLENLDNKVEKHNQMVERTYKLEQETAVLKEEMKVEQHRTEDLENAMEKANDKLINITRRNAI